MARARRVRGTFKFKPFSRKQKQVLTWWLDSSPVSHYDGIIADGAIRSGKTVSMSLAYVMWAMETFDNQNLGMAGKTIGAFRRNVITGLKPMLLSRGYYFTDRVAENYLEVTRNGKTNYFYIFGGKDESSQDLIQGITLAGMFFDEVALMPESFVNQATGRCSVDGSKFWFNCNPDGPYHWFKTNWIDDDEKKLVYLHFTMNDNLSLSEAVKARYRSMYSGVFYDRYIRGLWTVAEGIIYDMFSKEKHVVNSAPDGVGDAYVSIDYGTQNPTVFLMWVRGADGVWYCDKEYYYSGREQKRQKTDGEFAEDLIDFIKGYPVKNIIVDPSAASFIAECRKNGLRVQKARNDVLDGIRLTSSALNEEQIKFNKTCKNTIKEFSSYVWDEKAANRGEDKPVKDNDHAMDAVRYFVNTVLHKPTGIKTFKGGI